MSPAFARVYARRNAVQYYRKKIKPRTHVIALEHFNNLDSALLPWTGRKTDLEPTPEGGIHAEGFKVEPWIEKWKRDMVDLFEKELEFCVELADTEGSFRFELPSCASSYDPRSMTTLPAQLHCGNGLNSSSILIALLPTVSVEWTSQPGGGREPRSVLSKAVVLL